MLHVCMGASNQYQQIYFPKSLIKYKYQKITLQTQVNISHTYVERNIDKRLTSVFQDSKCSISFVKQELRIMVKSDQQEDLHLNPTFYLLPLPCMYSDCCLANCKQTLSLKFQVSPLLCQLSSGQISARGGMVELLKHWIKRFECYLPSLDFFPPVCKKKEEANRGKGTLKPFNSSILIFKKMYHKLNQAIQEKGKSEGVIT